MKNADLKDAILELCAEDYYGAWELYWKYQGLMGTKDVDDELFIAALRELTAAKKIVPYDRNRYSNEFERTTLDLDRLRSELQEVRAGNVTDDIYWFSHS